MKIRCKRTCWFRHAYWERHSVYEDVVFTDLSADDEQAIAQHFEILEADPAPEGDAGDGGFDQVDDTQVDQAAAGDGAQGETPAADLVDLVDDRALPGLEELGIRDRAGLEQALREDVERVAAVKHLGPSTIARLKQTFGLD